MSLVGNLEDLSLGDILQIISLSQKSGVLALSGDYGSGRIVFRNGLVQAACLKGEANDLRELLVGSGKIDPAGFDAAETRSVQSGVAIMEAVAQTADLSVEDIEGMVQGAAEKTILEMFSWPAGDFSFDVRAELDPEDPQMILERGINAQYLAMEGLRLRDERERDGTLPGMSSAEAVPSSEGKTDPPANRGVGLSVDPLFGDASIEEPLLETHEDDLLISGELTLLGDDELLGADETTATDVVVASVLDREDGTGSLTKAPGDALPTGEVRAEPEAAPMPSERVAAAAQRPPQTAPGDRAASPSAQAMPVVLIDPDIAVLDWVKSAIEDEFARVHVFQQADQGLSRIRQYLIRGETPLVIISPRTEVDPLSGIQGLGDFVKRLKAQSPRLVVLGLRDDEDAAPSAMPTALNGVLRRPSRKLLVEKNQPEGASASRVLLRSLLEILAHGDPGTGAVKDEGVPPDKAALGALREATEKLQEASSRGEVLPVVLDFAAGLFDRVAILAVRDDEVFAIAGRGIAALEVDPLESSPPIAMPIPETGWIRRLLDTRKAQVGAPRDPSDHLLLDRLGCDQSRESYLGPIESGASVIAMLYGDQGSGERSLPDAQALEVVLQHAGLALDRAALERALWEADASGR